MGQKCANVMIWLNFRSAEFMLTDCVLWTFEMMWWCECADDSNGEELQTYGRHVKHICKYASVTAYIHDMLHWLPVAKRISYRIALLAVPGVPMGALSSCIWYTRPPRSSFYQSTSGPSCYYFNYAALRILHCRPLHLDWTCIGNVSAA